MLLKSLDTFLWVQALILSNLDPYLWVLALKNWTSCSHGALGFQECLMIGGIASASELETWVLMSQDVIEKMPATVVPAQYQKRTTIMGHGPHHMHMGASPMKMYGASPHFWQYLPLENFFVSPTFAHPSLCKEDMRVKALEFFLVLIYFSTSPFSLVPM